MGVSVIKDSADQQQFDATKVEGLDPAYHYRWVRKDPVNVTRQQLKGYETVVKAPEMVHVVSDRTKLKKGEDQTTAIEWGDLILMRTPKDNHEARLAQKRARILRQTKGVAAGYKAAIARMTQAEESRELAFEEHTDTSRGYQDTVSESEFVRQMDQMPEDEGPRIGRR